MVIVCPSAADTRALGRRLASLLGPGDVILLAGELGAGKTVLAGGIAEGLGVDDRVVSPSFVLAREYKGFVPVIHADLYRLGSLAEVDDLDLATDAADGVLIVEWGDIAEQRFVEDHLLIRIQPDDEGEVRTVTLIPRGSWSDRSLDVVQS